VTCWCGNPTVLPFSDDYARCAKCETLIFTGTPAQLDARVHDDQSDFYGWDYFHRHQQDVNGNHYPTIESRARGDLSERCIYWLNALLRFKLPPARVFELGSAHGAFVAMLAQAGFDAVGSDLSPSIVQMARDTFGVRMLDGPVEELSIQPGSLDCIALMDVIEHMPHPRETMAHCLTLLKPDGVIFLQTPRYPEGKSLNALRGDRFMQQLKPGEHLQLFSQQSIATLFASIGAPHIQFMPPIFWFYDMFCIVSRRALIDTAIDQRDAALQTTPQSRMIQAMLDAENRFRDLLAKHRDVLKKSA
jgi:2-polyprenyl-3-methyl-5-hydroxy-6-metoxy-1,4-benzoquinol methylase